MPALLEAPPGSSDAAPPVDSRPRWLPTGGVHPAMSAGGSFLQRRLILQVRGGSSLLTHSRTLFTIIASMETNKKLLYSLEYIEAYRCTEISSCLHAVV